MTRTTLRCALLSGLVALGGCSDSDDDSPSTVTVTVEVTSFEPGASIDPSLEGALVCVLNTDDCAVTNADGEVTLELPANAESGFEVTAEDTTATLLPQTTGTESISGLVIPVLSNDVASLLAGILDTPYPPVGTGIIATSVLAAPITDPDNGIAGVTLTPGVPSTSYYLDEDEIPRRELTETTEPSGAGGFIEVPGGELEITLGGNANNCVIASGWPGSTDASFRVPVRDGFFTQSFVTCDP